MKPSIGSVCYAHLPFEEMMQSSVRAGFTRLELICIPTWIHVNLRETTPVELTQRVEDAGMELVVLYPGGVDTSDPDVARGNIDYIRHTCDFAQEAGVNRIVFTGCERDTPLQASIDAYAEMAEHLAGTEVVIALENHYRNRLETIEDYREIFRQIDSPNLGITIDTGHFTSSNVDMFDLIDELGSKVAHVHLKDHIGTESVAIGKGETPNRKVLAKLGSIGYDDLVSLELEVKDPENTDVYAREALELMSGLLGR